MGIRAREQIGLFLADIKFIYDPGNNPKPETLNTKPYTLYPIPSNWFRFLADIKFIYEPGSNPPLGAFGIPANKNCEAKARGKTNLSDTSLCFST